MYDPNSYPRHDDTYVENGLLKTEIDRLRAGIDKLNASALKKFNAHMAECNIMHAENDRLRAENALMRDLLSEAYPIVENERSPDIPWCQEVTIILAKTAKEGE